MHDPRTLTDPGHEAVRRLARRSYRLDAEPAAALLTERTEARHAADQLRAEGNRIAQSIRGAAPSERPRLAERARGVKALIRKGDERARQAEQRLTEFLLAVPNLPDDDCPDGASGHDAAMIRTWGEPKTFEFEPRDHATRGLIRLHQFSKVELVRICDSARSRAELDLLVSHAEAALQELGLAHRVVALAAGDLGFAARFTYDVEVWLPGQGCYREISSCSDTGDFQARRAGIRMIASDGSRRLAATLNGSALPIGRTLAAILEQGQRADGSVRLPEALAPYAGFTEIRPDGTTAISIRSAPRTR